MSEFRMSRKLSVLLGSFREPRIADMGGTLLHVIAGTPGGTATHALAGTVLQGTLPFLFWGKTGAPRGSLLLEA